VPADQITQRRARRDDSLATAVVELVEAIQHPVPTTAARLILADQGREASAERLGTLAAYERQDHARTRMPPRLCPAIDANANALKPRWWTGGNWRLERRIITPDAVPGALAVLTVYLCRYHADRPQPASPELISYTVGLANQVAELPYFDTPASPDDWMNLRAAVHGPYSGVLSNLTGTTGEQEAAGEQLRAANLPGTTLLFGR
jgi:hypothetical protein